MKKLLVSTLFAFMGMFIATAQSFEGVIEFRKQSTTDTVNYVYYVKGDKVRIDEIGSKSKKAEGSFIIDLKNQSILSMSHDSKIYFTQAGGTKTAPAGKPEVKKTGNVKTIQGTKCSEYIVTNLEDSIKITYWMAANNYDFFFKLLKVLNRKDKSAVYIQHIAGAEGMFPFLSSQVNLSTNKEEVRMEATKVAKKTIESSVFDIPADYKEFQMQK